MPKTLLGKIGGKSPAVCAVWTFVLVFAISASAAAQARVRVVNDRTTIWRRDAPLAATTVKVGTVLDVIGRDEAWYIVVIPPEYGGTGETGLVAVSSVELVAGSPPIASTPRVPVRPGTPSGASARTVTRARPVEVFGAGQVGLSAWLAHQTFAAVMDHSFGPLFGGAIEVRLRGRFFIEGAVERFEQTGQRVFVSDGAVFKLGIRDTVRIIPVSVTAGYRREYRTATAYVGGGAGAYFYRETSDAADPSENLDERFTSYHALAGVEFGGRGVLRTAFEVQFTTVPNALASGAADAFGEHNLGGVEVRIKILAGR
jgi:hypothetical protein